MTAVSGRPDLPDNELRLRHVEAMLARVDVAVAHEVVRWQLAGQDASDQFRGLHISDDQARQLLARPFGTSWGQMVELEPEQAQAFAAAEAQVAADLRALTVEAHSQGQELPLERLASAFELDPFELDALLVCLAPALDLRYERLYAYLQDDVTRKRPTVSLLLDLLCGPGPQRLALLSRFGEDAPLFRYHLLERHSAPAPDSAGILAQPLSVDPAVVMWLLGQYQPHAGLGPRAALHAPAERQADRLLVGDACAEIELALRLQEPIVALRGVDSLRQEAAARLLAARAARLLLAVDLLAAQQGGVPPLQAMRLALRDARLLGAIPYLSNWDVCLESGSEGPVASAGPPPELLGELFAHPGLAVVGSQSSWQASQVERERTILWLELGSPAHAQRRRLWAHYLGDLDSSAGEGQGEAIHSLGALAGQFALTSGQIRDAVASARDGAAARGSPLQAADLLAAARSHSNPRLGTLARKIEPRYAWSDIILPADQLALLQEIVAAVRGRPQVLDAWGVGRKLARSSGVPILFAGPPGTGKTMAAEIIAGELELDLYGIDLSTVVSKYIGETEKNLERIFGEAQSSNAILFFDEADAIFGKRSEVKDAHDRYANIETSYLLQRMEAYDGVTILATNLRANLDEAFTRRLQFAVDFPFPEEEYRLRIWQTLFPPTLPRAADVDFGLLAGRFRLAGGNIRNVIVSAAYLAAADGRQVTMEHLLHGVRRELQKMGRLVRERDMALLGGDYGQ